MNPSITILPALAALAVIGISSIDSARADVTPEELDELGLEFYVPETHQFAPGDLIPQVFHIYLKPVPNRYMSAMDAPSGDVDVRQMGDMVYYLNPQTYEVIKAVEYHSLASR